MARAVQVSFFEREVRIRLSSAAIELLFERASVLSEGQLEEAGYYGSTMITVDCARAAHLISDACDAAIVNRVRELAARDERVLERASGIGAAEAERMAGEPLDAPQVDLSVRASGTHLHIDLDVEARQLGSRMRAL